MPEKTPWEQAVEAAEHATTGKERRRGYALAWLGLSRELAAKWLSTSYEWEGYLLAEKQRAHDSLSVPIGVGNEDRPSEVLHRIELLKAELTRALFPQAKQA